MNNTLQYQNKKLIFIVISLIFLIGTISFSQAQNKVVDFFRLSVQEKTWVICHPFIAKKAWKITNLAKIEANMVKNDFVLDGNENGGQIDAFRHAYWMASLSQNIKYKKAYKLGLAHERKNKADYRKNKYEEGQLPDAISGEMDLLNNRIGLDIGVKNSKLKNQNLRQLIIEKILAGELWIVKTDRNGNYLDEYDNVLQESEYKGKWENSKCLIKSDYK